MNPTYLQVTVAIWGFLAATVLGITIHAIGTRRRSAAFDRHAIDALGLFAGCWPEPDDDVTRCETCSVLWTPTRVCGGGAR